MSEHIVGKMVWFYRYSSSRGHEGPLAAYVAHILSEHYVNLMVIDDDGNPRSERSVFLLRNGDIPACNYCCWAS